MADKNRAGRSGDRFSGAPPQTPSSQRARRFSETKDIVTDDAQSVSWATIAARVGRGKLLFYAVYMAALLGANAVILIPAMVRGNPGGNSLFIASWILLQAVAVVFVVLSKQHDGRLGTWVAAATVYLGISCAWSAAPQTSIVYGGMLVCNLLVAYLLAIDLSPREIVHLSGWVIFALVCVGMAAYYLGYQPAVYVDIHDRANFVGGVPARGFFPHKITAAFYAALGFVAITGSTRDRLKLAVALVVTVWFILLTGSATGLILLIAALILRVLVMMSIKRMVSRGAWFLAVVTGGGLFAGLLSLVWSALLNDLGRDATLTGRTILWEYGIRAFLERPLGGWGFAAYFNSDEWTVIQRQVAAFSNYDVPHFHQSYIQTAVDLGTPGLVALVWGILFLASRSYSMALREDPRVGGAVFALVCTTALAATAMFVLLTYNHFATFLMAVLLFAVARQGWITPAGVVSRTGAPAQRAPRSKRPEGLTRRRIDGS